MSDFRNFDTVPIVDPPSFTLVGKLWVCVPKHRMSWARWGKLLALLAAPGAMQQELANTRDALVSVIVEEQRDAFRALLDREDGDEIVVNGQVREVLDWVLHAYQ